MPTSEIFRIGSDGSETYAGYAKFDSEGNYLGSFGGNGRTRAGRTTNASEVQRAIRTSGARQAARTPRVLR